MKQFNTIKTVKKVRYQLNLFLVLNSRRKPRTRVTCRGIRITYCTNESKKKEETGIFHIYILYIFAEALLRVVHDVCSVRIFLASDH